MTAPDMVSIIEAALIPHNAKVVYYNADEGHVECHGCDWQGPSFTGFAAHQARAVLAALSEAHMLRPKPWPPIPYPENTKHQARWTIQRAHDAAWFRTSDHNEGHIAAADALLAEGWTPPQTAVEG